jgi:hypothetical protein
VKRRLVFVAVLAAVGCSSTTAFSEDAYTRANSLHHFAVDGDPFALLPGRIWADLQWLPVEHHAIVVSPYVLYYDSTITPFAAGDTRTLVGYGAQLEYRLYSGTRGANGFFVGAGGIIGHTNATAGTSLNGMAFPAQDFVYTGGQIDGGVQGILDSGFLVGGGGSIQVTENLQPGAKPAVYPRLLFTLGYAF